MIKTIKESGFCYGVQAAVDRANANFANVPDGVYLFGDLANNSHVMATYRAKGFHVAKSIEEIPQNTIVIIRAHGVPRVVYDNLREKGAKIEDCTCVKVKKIHKIVEEKSAAGYLVVIVGKKDHPEVIGTQGWCDNAVILETEADLHDINVQSNICVVAQTTCKRDWWNKATELVLKKCPTAEIYNTLCSVLTEKLDQAAEIAQAVDAMIIVGDKKSANSLELYNTCAKICAQTYFVSSLSDVPAINPTATVGLAGSASAPAEIVAQIHDCLTFANFLAKSKAEIDEITDRHVRNKQLVPDDVPFVDEAVLELYRQNEGGKRIRGAMIKLGEKIALRSSTGDSQSPVENIECTKYLSVAVAYELFQTAILIHDDVIDRSETRRGKKTIHAAAKDARLAKGDTSAEARHFGTSRALCVGDYGLFLANHLIATAQIDDRTKVRLFNQFSSIQLTTLEGEIMDVTLPAEPIDPVKNYAAYMDAVYQIYESKTAWYTLAGPLKLGAICGGADNAFAAKLADIALPLGLAFQIKDDMLGMYADDMVLGKPAISDMHEKKQTLIYGYAYKHATAQQRQTLDDLYGKQTATTADLRTVREIFTATGAAKFADDEITKLSAQSLELIDALQTDDECKILLRGLVYYLLVRKY